LTSTYTDAESFSREVHMVKPAKFGSGVQFPPLESISVEDLARSPAAHLRAIQADGTPRVLTHRGRKSAVVLDRETFSRLIADAGVVEMRRALDESFDQMDRGEVQPAVEAIDKMRKELKRRYAAKAARKPRLKGR
jgi:PHD/YefM family antitoxin component YafN of YafNO toxin-antitoxin module